MSAEAKKNPPQSRRRFTDEFKREAVQMMLDGHSTASVVERLGLSSVNLLYRWKRELLRGSGPVPGLPSIFASISRYLFSAEPSTCNKPASQLLIWNL